MLKSVEPFAELQATAEVADTWRLGFRLIRSLEVIAELHFPADVLWTAISKDVWIDTSISASGDVISSFGNSGKEGGWRQTKCAIDDLVEKAVNPENIRMAEARVADLDALLKRLERSVGLTRNALQTLQVTDGYPDSLAGNPHRHP